MKITELKLNSGYNGQTIVDLWVTCHTIEEVDDVIAWMQFAKQMMLEWQKLHKDKPKPVTKLEPKQQAK